MFGIHITKVTDNASVRASFKTVTQVLPGGSVIKNTPGNTGNMGLISDPDGSTGCGAGNPWSSATTTELVPLEPRSLNY